MRKINEETRQLILKSAREILATEGVENLNIRKLAINCNIGLGTLYNYYKSKQELIREIVQNQYNDIFERLKIQLSNEDDTYKKLKMVFESLRNFNIELNSISFEKVFPLLSKVTGDDIERIHNEGCERWHILRSVFKDILKDENDFYIESIMLLYVAHATNSTIEYSDLENLVKDMIEAKNLQLA